MHPSPIIEELHEFRRRYAEQFGNDLHAICEDARRRQAKSARTVVPAHPKPLAAPDGHHPPGPKGEG